MIICGMGWFGSVHPVVGDIVIGIPFLYIIGTLRRSTGLITGVAVIEVDGQLSTRDVQKGPS